MILVLGENNHVTVSYSEKELRLYTGHVKPYNVIKEGSGSVMWLERCA